MSKEVKVPANVMVHGQQNPVSVDKKGNISFKEKDPLAPIKHSPFEELLPATEEWVKKYGGSDVSIVAFNVSEILKGQENAKSKTKRKGPDETDEGEGEGADKKED